MALTLTDTSCLLAYLAGQEPVATYVAEELESGTLAVTPLTSFQLLSAARSPRQENQFRQLLNALTSLPIDATIAGRAAELRRSPQPAHPVHSLIAAAALHHSARLLTRQPSLYPSAPGLRFYQTKPNQP
jgi:predicted nucleic acid-binding protein